MLFLAQGAEVLSAREWIRMLRYCASASISASVRREKFNCFSKSFRLGCVFSKNKANLLLADETPQGYRILAFV